MIATIGTAHSGFVSLKSDDYAAPRSYEERPKLVGRRVALRPLTSQDYNFIYAISIVPDNIVRWRFRGATPSPEQLPQAIWQGVLTQFLIVRTANGEPLGLITAYNADLRNGNVYVAQIVAPQYERQGWIIDSSTLFLAYLFETWNFRKVYYEMLEFNYARIASGAGRYFHVEGCLRNHEYHDGRYWNLYYLAIYREEHAALTADLLPRILSPELR